MLELRRIEPVRPASSGPHFSDAEKLAMQKAMVNLSDRWGLTIYAHIWSLEDG